MRPTVLRALLVLGLVTMLFPVGAGVAAAHGGPGIGPEQHVPRVLALDPPVPGLLVAVIEGGERLRLDNRTGVPVGVVPPAGAARTVEPVVAPGATARWTDPRVVAAAADPVPVGARRPWTVPLQVGDRTVALRGEQVWPPAPPAGLWWLATLLVAGAVAVAGTRAVRRPARAPVLAAITALVTAAHVVHVLGSALVVEGRPLGAVVLGAAGPALVAWAFAVAGIARTLARRDDGPLRAYGPLFCALSGAVFALVTAFNANSFAGAVLPFVGSADLDRATTVLTVGGGVGLFLVGFAALRELTEQAPVAAEVRRA